MAEQVSSEVHAEYERIHATEDFKALKRIYSSFVFPTTVAFMLWYITYVLCSNYAEGFMAHKVAGHINVALIFGLLQFVTTFAIAWAYARYSAQKMDPIADKLRHQFESEVGA